MKSTGQKRRDFVKRLGQAIGITGAGLAPQVFAENGQVSANIKSVTLKQSGNGQQQLIFKLDKKIQYKIFTLKSPDRVVIDFFNTQSKTLKLGRNKLNNIQSLRQSSHPKYLRVVLDVNASVKTTSHLSAKGSSYYLDVGLQGFSQIVQQAPKKPQVKKAVSAVNRNSRKKLLVVAIDAGHGGRDPGAVGKKKTEEKVIVLQIAKRLKKHVDRQPGMKGVLIRDGDYSLALKSRTRKARKKKADLFISIHADAHNNRRLTGSHVYILSPDGASSESARWLANSENSSDKKLGLQYSMGKNKYVDDVLVDMVMANTIDRSLSLAGKVLSELGNVNKLLRKNVESAGFRVLKSPDIPSMLIETAFISNVMEEKRLKNSRYQEKLAKAIFKGVRRYHQV